MYSVFFCCENFDLTKQESLFFFISDPNTGKEKETKTIIHIII